MESLECRFRLGRAGWEAVLLIAFCFVAASVFGFQLDPRLADPPTVFVSGAGLSVLGFAFLIRRRWRTRFLIDDRGVEFRRSKQRVVTRLEWGEIDEIFLLGWADFEIRGAGKRIRLAGPYEGISQARGLCTPLLNGIRDHLRLRAFREGRIVFRMPGGRWKAHLAYFAAVLVLTAMTALCIAPFVNHRVSGFPIILVLLGAGWLWGLWKKASGLGTRVTLQRDGVVVRRLDGKDRVAWQEFDHSEWSDKDGLNLVLRAGRVISLPSTLGNIAMLEEFLREGPPSVDSGTPEQAEGRTMMQSP